MIRREFFIVGGVILVLLGLLAGEVCVSVRLAGPSVSVAKDLQLGQNTAARGEYDAAISFFNDAIRIDPKNARAYNDLGIVRAHKHEYDEAIADYGHAIQLEPDDATPYYNRGLAYIRERDYDKAIASFDQAIQLNPQVARYYWSRGLAYKRKVEDDKAIADFNWAIEVDPKLAPAYNDRGATYRAMGEYDKASADFDRAVKLDPRHAAYYYQQNPPHLGPDNGPVTLNARKPPEGPERKDPGGLQMLAAACAKAGDFDDAIKWESQYLGTPNLSASDLADAQHRLALYRTHQPYRENK